VWREGHALRNRLEAHRAIHPAHTAKENDKLRVGLEKACTAVAFARVFS
jgi:hypothetical protein